jgi:negative regulator of sigma E activity
MSKRKEKISAFLDSDMHQDELMSFSLSTESEDAKIVQRYQMIGDTLRGELNNSSFIDVSHAVSEAIAGEIIMDANPALRNKTWQSKNNQSVPAASSWGLSAWFKPVAGMAFAVMVAVGMVMTIPGQDATSLAPVATNVDTVDQATTVADISQKPAESKNSSNMSVDKKATGIDPYINQHLEYATQDALQGRLPYIRAVNYEAGK